MRYYSAIVLIFFFSLIATDNIYCKEYIIIKGKVLNSKTADNIGYVNIQVKNSFRGTVSDEEGAFRLRIIKNKKIVLIFTRIGFKTKDILLDTVKNINNLTVYLEPSPCKFDAIVIEEEEIGINQFASKFNIPYSSLKNIPMMSEPDIIRSLSILPSTSQYNNLRSDINIRGGSSYDHLILLDGFEAYKPYHLFGVFSGFNPYIVKKVEYYPGSFPLKYGDKLYGLVSIDNGLSFDELPKKVILYLGLNSLNTVYKRRYNSLDITMGARIFHLGLLIPYRFYDFNLSMKLKISPSDIITATGFYNRDYFKYNTFLIKMAMEQIILKWGTSLLGVKYIKQFNEKYSFRLQISNLRKYENKDYNKTIRMPVIHNFINNKQIRMEFQIKQSKTNVNFGYFASDIRYNYEWNLINLSDLDYILYSDLKRKYRLPNYNVYRDGIFVENMVSWKDNISSLAEIKIINYKNKKYISYRTGIKFITNSGIELYSYKFKNYQFDYITKEEHGFKGSYLIFPQNIPMLNNAFEIGFNLEAFSSYRIKSSFYIKHIDNRMSRISYSYLRFEPVKEKGYGYDFYIQKFKGSFRFQFSYTWMRLIDIKDDLIYPGDWDITHSIKVLSGYEYKNKWFINIAYFYSSGLPYTPAIALIDQNVYVFGATNAKRFPENSRIDLSFRKQFFTKMGKRYTIYFQISHLDFLFDIVDYMWEEDELFIGKEAFGVGDYYFVIPTIGVEIEL